MTTSNEFVGPPDHAVTRIGRTGTKLHPVVNPDGRGWMALCSCPGTNSGHWQDHAQIMRGVASTCKSR